MAQYYILAIIGILFGSFITMLSHRLVHGGSYLDRSKCIRCGHRLKVTDLLPVLSYMLLRGKCRYCKRRISVRYPLIEAFTALAFAGLGGYWPNKMAMLFLMGGCTIALVTMIVIDFEHMIIPDEIQFMLAAIGILIAFLNGIPFFQIFILPTITLITALFLKYGFLFFTKKDGLGWGDVKFFAVAGLYLTVDTLATFLFLSGFIGIGIAALWKLAGKGERFPFGPALAISLYLCILLPDAANITNFIK